MNLSKEHWGNSHEELLCTFIEAPVYQGRSYKKYTGKSCKWLIRLQRVHVYFYGAFPKRTIYTVNTCQFGILRSLLNVLYCCFNYT